MAKPVSEKRDIRKPSRKEKYPTTGYENDFTLNGITIVCDSRGKDIDDKKYASKGPVDSPKSTDLGTSVVSIKAESNNVEKDTGR